MTKQINYGSEPAKWPYPVRYDAENRIETDVLIIGAGIAGAMAGLMAARRGVRVAVVDKSPVDISGSGGSGLDHYLDCFSNPDCTLSPEEIMDLPHEENYFMPRRDHRSYIHMKGSWENLLEMEKLGLHFRDEEDEFKGAPFRDDKTKIMYAYDYKTKSSIRLRGGAAIKKHMRNGLTAEPNVSLFERVMITSLLSEDGKAGARIAGATGFNEETGEFYVFSAKCVIISTAGVSMQGTQTWTFNSEMFANGYRADPRNTGDGVAMAWNAGAELYSEQSFGQTMMTGPFGWPWYGIGNPDNTWHPCTLVDNKGTVIPWIDSQGNPISTIEERTLPAPGELYMSMSRPTPYIDPELIRNGTYELPLWADLSSLPEHERRGIWGLMVGNEGRTRYAVYDYYNKAGFNPDTDMLMCPVMTPENFGNQWKDWFQGEPDNNKFWKADTLRGIASDWKQMSNIAGLFVSGSESGQGGAVAGSSGCYAGNRAAEYAQTVSQGKISEEQIAAEKARVYAPVRRSENPEASVSWKELWMGMNRVMQQDCGEFRSAALCRHGLMWLDSIKKFEMQRTYARNPHELARVLEAESRVTVAEIYLYLCLANFESEAEDVSKDKLMFTKLINGELIRGYKEDGWWLKAPYKPTYKENYEAIRANEVSAKEAK
ncbi:MAG: FAD-binding protein [Oscillospiraceae bacterium]|jgi:succinate dehydrogenase/fumarate reductase flavoprotein subunit|nr:FAD-binding protein [Oscillospiraceae bacterium]